MIGPAIQTSYVVADMDAAIAHWVDKFEVGSFFLNRRMRFENAWCFGVKTPIEIASATAYWGDMQIELIQPLSSGPNVYRGPWDGAFMTMHHLGTLSDDIDRDIARMDALGFPRALYLELPGVRIGYFDIAQGAPGGLVELIPATESILQFFATMKRAAQGWDGTNPIREKPGA